MPVFTQHYAMLECGTFSTRAHGKRLVGQKKAIAIAVRNISRVGVGRSWASGCPGDQSLQQRTGR
jgi:hypothetical protein